MTQVIRAFSQEQAAVVLQELITLTRLLGVAGITKIEEDHWSAIYCRAKGIPHKGWSNLLFHDVIHEGLGVESKLLRRNNPFGDVGKCLMHPAATRRIEFDPSRSSAEECKTAILKQWRAHIEDFRKRVRATNASGNADLRWGVLLWGSDLRRFLYFEERLVSPDPAAFTAEWSTGKHRGAARENLYIFEKATGQKRYSVTLPTKGAKLQPYFDIPSAKQGAHLFQLPTEEDLVPVWIPRNLQHKVMDMMEQYAETTHPQEQSPRGELTNGPGVGAN